MDIESLVVEGAGQSFKGDDFRMLCKPCVYMFMKNGLPIYVGMSRNGISRPASRAHAQAEHARSECDEVKIYPCVSEDAARNLEEMLIAKTQPPHNVNGVQRKSGMWRRVMDGRTLGLPILRDA